MTPAEQQKFRWPIQKIAIFSQSANLSSYFRESLRAYGWKTEEIIPDFKIFLQTVETMPYGALIVDGNNKESIFEIFMTVSHLTQFLLKPIILLLEESWKAEAEDIKIVYNVFPLIKPITSSKIIDTFKAIQSRFANSMYLPLLQLDANILQFGPAKIETLVSRAETSKVYQFYTRILLAFNLENSKRLKEAEKMLLDSAKLFPGNPYLLLCLSRFYARNGLNAISLKLLQKIRSRNPSAQFLGFDLAVSQCALGDYDAAGEALLKIIQKSPNCEYLASNLARIFLTNGRIVELGHQFPSKKARLETASSEWDALENVG